MFNFENKLIKTDVTAVKLFNNYILAGIGGQLLIYKQNEEIELKHKLDVFKDGFSIHGIEINSSKYVLLYGGTKISIYNFNSLERLCSVSINDWILAAKWLKNNTIAIMVMSNKLLIFDIFLQKINEFTCKEKCILYSAYICDNFNELILMSGTVFSEVLIWKPSNTQTCHVSTKLQGHKGVIFDISYNPTCGLICSCSDDRSTIIWQCVENNLELELAKPNPNIIPKFKVFGHTSRIFRCKMLETCVISAGEDSLLNIWDLSGQIVQKIDTHQGGCIWAIDANSNFVVSGGGDAGVSLFPLKANRMNSTFEIPGQFPKKITIMKSGNVVIFSESGSLFYVRKKQQHLEEIANFDYFKGYCLLEVSQCRQIVALAGYHGEIILYKEQNDILQQILTFQTDNKSRIFALHWLSCKTLLTCEKDGLLSYWYLNNSDLHLVKHFNLPKSKEVCSTAACCIGNGMFVVGDRKGNMFLFNLEYDTPIQIFKKAHNYLGITKLLQCEQNLVSLGRDGFVKTYSLKNKQLDLISSDKLPFSWLLNRDNQFLLAFSGSDFVVFDYKAKRVVFQQNCGGGHRSWDFYDTKESITFCFIKDKTVSCVTSKKKTILPIDIIAGFHTKEINALTGLKIANNRNVLVSGGEDTHLSISLITENDSFQNLVTLKSHLSNIRCITKQKLTENEFLLFSGGGREQIIVWHLYIDEINIKRSVCREMNSFYEKSDANNAETRIMDLENDGNVLYAACSDGKICIFQITNQFQLVLIKQLFSKRKCITKLAVIELMFGKVLISWATDGNATFWNISSELEIKNCATFNVHQSGVNAFCYYVISNNLLACLTGGDDNSIVLTIFLINLENKTLKIDQVCEFKDIGTHCAQVTGAFIMSNHFITCSIDQKLVVFEWKFEKNRLDCRLISRFDTAIPDVQGIECFNYDTYFDVFIFGKGLNYIKCKK